ncbi:MAG: hydantoinase B/oxoprolinase family protein, partial [Bauldia litoralis]
SATTRSGSLEPVPGCAEVVIGPDQAMVSISCGGGGYGPPEEREPERVVADVREGWVSRERAEMIYAVAFTESLELDTAGTALIRKDRAQAG